MSWLAIIFSVFSALGGVTLCVLMWKMGNTNVVISRSPDGKYVVKQNMLTGVIMLCEAKEEEKGE